MVQVVTFPTQEVLQQIADNAEPYKRPNTVPIAAVSEGFIHADDCRAIAEACEKFKSYQHRDCGAVTREIGHIPELDFIKWYGHQLNNMFWQYDLDPETTTWMQTYETGGDYQLHADGIAGHMRKLTIVLLLSDGNDYEGGDLEIFWHPLTKVVPRSQGTIVAFQPWILHKVHPVISGKRQSLNMSFWGPNFR